MTERHSIGVVIPTLNCAHLLPDHLDSMQPWLDLVEQIVVVDSYSDDGTWEMLQKRLAGHPQGRLFTNDRADACLLLLSHYNQPDLVKVG